METKNLTLALVREDQKILLGRKKRGFGEGKWNGFGGKIEENETVEEAACRELMEEAFITPVSMDKRGTLTFEFLDTPLLLYVTVFHVPAFTGEPMETEEMKPQWFHLSDIPYDEMWIDDKYWFPLFLADKKFNGRFVFKDMHHITEHTLEVLP